MMRFEVGDVNFEEDPKGRLFYQSGLTWPTARRSIYTIFYFKGQTLEAEPEVVVRADFYAIGTGAGKLTPFARFLAKVKGSSRLPPIVPGLGQGKWAQLKAATCPVQANRFDDDPQINLASNSIGKQVYFATKTGGKISQSGIMFFTKLSKLKTQPNGINHCMADYSERRIVFYIEGARNEVVALFVPNKPMDTIGPGGTERVQVTWRDFKS